MTTRHVSGQTAYPFEEPSSSADRELVEGILDAFFVIQGAPDSTGVAPDRDWPYVKLISITDQGTEYRYRFNAVKDTDLWQIDMDVLKTGGPGQVRVGSSVMIFDTAITYSGADQTGLELFIEPGRTAWHTRGVSDFSFYNIERCEGVEDPTVLHSVTTWSSGTLNVIDGYNTLVDYADGALQFTGGAGLGKGQDPGFGDECTSPPDPTPVVNAILSINGLIPQQGDIPVEVSPSLWLEREEGKLTIHVRSSEQD